MNYFISAIDTNVGKTVFSAILAKALGYSYWKPIQCGDLDNTDSMKIKEWTNVNVHPEAYRLQQPMSPHQAAKLSGVDVNLKDIDPPVSNHLVIEGAGGIMVPLNYNGELVIDIAKKTGSEVIIVVKNYLGSINHSLLSCEYFKIHKIPVKGLVIMGETMPSSEEIIEKISGFKILCRIPYSDLNTDFISDQAKILKESWDDFT